MSNEFKELWNTIKHYWQKFKDGCNKIGLTKRTKSLWNWIKEEYGK